MSTFTLYDWIILILAVGYATYAVTDNDGPLHVFRHIRNLIERVTDWLICHQWIRLAGLVESFKDLMDCYVCLSVWIGLLIIGYVYHDVMIVESFAIASVVVIVRKGFSAYVERGQS